MPPGPQLGRAKPLPDPAPSIFSIFIPRTFNVTLTPLARLLQLKRHLVNINEDYDPEAATFIPIIIKVFGQHNAFSPITMNLTVTLVCLKWIYFISYEYCYHNFHVRYYLL